MVNIIVVNTKGGTGKTNIALNVLPVLMSDNNGKIMYYQLDNNNKLSVKSKNIEIKEFKLNALSEALSEIEFSESDVNIIDAGGGDDARAVLEEVTNSILENVKFIIPVSKNLSVRYNIKNTIDMIKERFENPDIYFAFNFVDEDKDIKTQYVNIFGDDIFNIKPLKELKDIQKAFGYVMNSNIFQILELNQETLLDSYLKMKNLADNKKTLLQTKKDELYKSAEKNNIDEKAVKEEYLLFRNKVRQAEKIVNLVENLKKVNENIIKNLMR